MSGPVSGLWHLLKLQVERVASPEHRPLWSSLSASSVISCPGESCSHSVSFGLRTVVALMPGCDGYGQARQWHVSGGIGPIGTTHLGQVSALASGHLHDRNSLLRAIQCPPNTEFPSFLPFPYRPVSRVC